MSIGHNGQLRAFVERVERLEEEIKAMNADKAEVYKEARSSGFDVKTLRKVVSARKVDAADRQEADALFDLYMAALGELPKEDPRARARAHVENIEENPPPSSSPVADLPEPSSPAEAKTGAEPPPSAPVEDFQPPAFLAKKHVLRPHCLEPHLCRSGTSDHCHHCKKALAESEAA